MRNGVFETEIKASGVILELTENLSLGGLVIAVNEVNLASWLQLQRIGQRLIGSDGGNR